MTCHRPGFRGGCALLGAAAVLVLAGRMPGAETAPVAGVEVRNLSGAPLTGAPVTFGQAFKRGDIRDGIAVRIGEKALPAQVDVKRRYDDGSVRFAVISAVIDTLPADGKVSLALSNGKPPQPAAAAVSRADLLKTDFDAVVALKFPDGAVRSASARRLLEQAGDAARVWLQGPVAMEWLLSGPLLDAGGKADEDLSVRFQVRAYAGCRLVRISVAVENCWDGWAGNIRYDAAVSVGGKQVMTEEAVDHRPLSRWRKVFWWGGAEPAAHIAHDLAYLSATGAIPRYDTTLKPAAPSRAELDLRRLEGPDWRIMGKGALTAYMPTTGGRAEIAPYPAWTVRYLLTMDPQAKSLVLAGGDMAGSWPIHVRARKTGRVLSIDDRPAFWLDERGKDKPQWKPARTEADPKQVRLSPDLAHQGSFAYVPYLVTGDYYFLEEAYFWANYCLIATWSEPRMGAKGILSDQIRGNAWGLRNIADAAWIAPDGESEARYFEEKVRSNIADYIRRMYGPPEFNRIGAWGVRTTDNARIQNPANPKWMVIAPWENDYLAWSLHHLVELGYADAARPRDFLLRLRVGSLTSAPDFDPMLAAPYRFVVGEQGPGGKTIFYEDWKTLGRENARLSRADLPNYGSSYAYSARAVAVCGVDGGFPKSAEALKWLEDHLPNHREMMAREPHWAIVPGGAAKGN